MIKKCFLIATYLIFIIACPVLITEIYSRKILLMKATPPYEIQPNSRPYFRLQKENLSEHMMIKDHRRENALRGHKPEAIAFVGDSVTFCTGVYDKDCFVEKIQTQQTQYDAYNLGVPGYGIPEIPFVIKAKLPVAHPSIIFYTFNYNDLFDAMPVLLSLLRTPSERLASWDDYSEGKITNLKIWMKDHFKTPFVLNYYFPQFMLFTRFGTMWPSPTKINAESVVTPHSADCSQELEAYEASSYLLKKSIPFWKRFAKDPSKIQLLSDYFLKMKIEASRKGSKLVVAIHHEYPFLKKHNQEIDLILKIILSEHQIASIDTWKLYLNNYKRCGFYLADDNHLGVLGNQIFAQHILQYLNQQKSKPFKMPEVKFSENFSLEAIPKRMGLETN